jgi:hypothetical protein
MLAIDFAALTPKALKRPAQPDNAQQRRHRVQNRVHLFSLFFTIIRKIEMSSEHSFSY